MKIIVKRLKTFFRLHIKYKRVQKYDGESIEKIIDDIIIYLVKRFSSEILPLAFWSRLNFCTNIYTIHIYTAGGI